MYKYILIISLLFTTLVNAQAGDDVSDVPWTIGIGVNIVDNDGLHRPFKTNNWNFKNPISINIERKITSAWSGNFAITINSLESDNPQNGAYVIQDRTFFALDVTGRYTYDRLFMDTPRVDPFEAYLLAGFGYTSAISQDAINFDLGLGFNIWIIQDIGIRLQTMGKFGSKNNNYIRNYIQHTIEFIVRF